MPPKKEDPNLWKLSKRPSLEDNLTKYIHNTLWHNMNTSTLLCFWPHMPGSRTADQTDSAQVATVVNNFRSVFAF
jgi:hypothetical protein